MLPKAGNTLLDPKNESVKPPKRFITITDLAIFLVFALVLVGADSYLRTKRYGITAAFIIVYLLLYSLLFLIYKAKPQKILLKVVRGFSLSIILLIMFSLVYLSCTSSLSQSISQRSHSDLYIKSNKLAQIGDYSPNRVLTEIGDVSPLEIIEYGVFFDQADDKVIYTSHTLNSNKDNATKKILGDIKYNFYDIGTHLVFTNNNYVTMYNKSNFKTRTWIFSENLGTEGYVETELVFTKLSEEFILIYAERVFAPEAGGKGINSEKFYVLNVETDEISSFDCQKDSFCWLKLYKALDENLFVLGEEFTAGKGLCAALGTHLIVLDMSSNTTHKIAETEDGCSLEEPTFLGFGLNNDLIFSISDDTGATLYSINPLSLSKTTLIDKDQLPNDDNSYKFFTITEDNIIAIQKNSTTYIIYDLKNNTVSFDETSYSGPKKTKMLPIKEGASIGSRNADDIPIQVKEISRKPLDLNTIVEVIDYSNNLVLSDETQIKFQISGLSELFEALIKQNNTYPQLTKPYVVSNVIVASDIGFLVELIKPEEDSERIRTATSVLENADLYTMAESYSDNSKRVGLINSTSGKVYLLDQNRVTQIEGYDDNDKVVTVYSPYEGNKYRALDIGTGDAPASFVLGKWYMYKTDPIYGPNLWIPLIDHFKLENDSDSYCIDPFNGRVKCILIPYELIVDGESTKCYEDRCTFIISAQEGIPLGEIKASPLKVGNQAKVTVTSDGSYTIENYK